MAEEVHKVKIQVRRGVESELTDLSTGEPALSTDTTKFFVGTGNGNKSQLAKQSQVDTIQADVTNAKTNITSLQTDNGKNKTDITQLKTDTSGLRNDLNAAVETVGDLGTAVEANEASIATFEGTKQEVTEARGTKASLKERFDSLEKAQRRQVLTATVEGQTVFTITNGSYVVGSETLRVTVGGVPQPPDAYTETNSTTVTLSEGVPVGKKVMLEWLEGKLPVAFGHNTSHYSDGQDPIDVTKLKNYQAEVADKIGILQTSVTTQLAEKVNKTEMSTYVNIKTFGAKGDGVTDDSQAFKIAFTSGVEGLFIPAGTYIVNITAGTNHNPRIFIDANVPNVVGIKGKSVIKLGSGNCDERNYRGFDRLFRYNNLPDFDISWENITIDYNNAQNPVYHYSAQYINGENNLSQCAIGVLSCRDFRLKNCTIIGHSGLNAIVYTANFSNTRDALVQIKHNKFLDIGHDAFYGDSSTKACHDHSTIYLHNNEDSTKNYPYRVIADIGHNEFVAFEDGASNANNPYEGGADVQSFYHNYVRGYWHGSLELSTRSNTIAKNYNNVCENVLRGVAVWPWNKLTNLTNNIAYQTLEIKNNRYVINPELFSTKPNFNEYTPDGNGKILHSSYGVVLNSQYRNIDTMRIESNEVVFTGNNGSIPFSGGNGIAFANFDTTTLSQFTSNPFLKNLIIQNNKFFNCMKSAVYYSTYPNTTNIIVKNNESYNCNNTATSGTTEPDSVTFYFALNGNTSTYNTNPVIAAYMENFIFENNLIRGDYAKYIVTLNIRDNAYDGTKGFIKFSNNQFDIRSSYFLKPYSIANRAQAVTRIVLKENFPYNMADFPELQTSFAELANTTGELKFKNGVWENGRWTVYSGSPSTIAQLNYKVADRIINTVPTESGTTGSKYIIEKWIATVAGNPATWTQCRTLTGN